MTTAMHLWMVIVVAMLCGCATELDLAEPELEPAAQTLPTEFRFIVPYVDRPQVDHPTSVVPTDPCDCEDATCVDAWAESQLACDVCVVLLCDDDWHPHVCHHC